ncbi:MAG: hypothetical protein R3A10_13265 [Caldilineaceae bacterium]
MAQALIARATEIADACSAGWWSKTGAPRGRCPRPTRPPTTKRGSWTYPAARRNFRAAASQHPPPDPHGREKRPHDASTAVGRRPTFYAVLSRFTHQSGTPVFGRSFVANVVKYLGGHFNIVTVYHEEKPIGSYFQLEMAETVYGV